MQDHVWSCTYCSNQHTEGWIEGMKLLKKYDDNICPVDCNPDEYLKILNSSKKNLQFTLEKENLKEDLAFLDINLNVNS